VNYADLILTYEEIASQNYVVADEEERYYSAKEYPYQEEMYKIIGACMEVHKELGYGFLESVYQEALCIELTRREIPFEADKLLFVYYKDVKLKKTFKADIYAYGYIIVELKAVMGSLDLHSPQVINYLTTTKHELGVLVNFGMPSLQWKRYIVSKNRKYH